MVTYVTISTVDVARRCTSLAPRPSSWTGIPSTLPRRGGRASGSWSRWTRRRGRSAARSRLRSRVLASVHVCVRTACARAAKTSASPSPSPSPSASAPAPAPAATAMAGPRLRLCLWVCLGVGVRQGVSLLYGGARAPGTWHLNLRSSACMIPRRNMWYGMT